MRYWRAGTVGVVMVILTGQGLAAENKIEIAGDTREIQLLTTVEKTPVEHLVANILQAMLKELKQGGNGPGYAISRVTDRELHLNPLLSQKVFDIGFAWQRPDCKSSSLSQNEKQLCTGFFFSKPLYQQTVRLFVRKGAELSNPGSGLKGKRFCVSHRLDWQADKVSQVFRLKSLGSCFSMALRDEVDGVVALEERGTRTLARLGKGNDFIMIEKPLAMRSFRAIIAKTHVRARIYLHYINSSINALKKSGKYDLIVAKAGVNGEEGKRAAR